MDGRSSNPPSENNNHWHRWYTYTIVCPARVSVSVISAASRIAIAIVASRITISIIGRSVSRRIIAVICMRTKKKNDWFRCTSKTENLRIQAPLGTIQSFQGIRWMLPKERKLRPIHLTVSRAGPRVWMRPLLVQYSDSSFRRFQSCLVSCTLTSLVGRISIAIVLSSFGRCVIVVFLRRIVRRRGVVVVVRHDKDSLLAGWMVLSSLVSLVEQ